jgi:hypothetical protein
MNDSFSLIRQDRDAWPAIRGYVYQVDQTILSWLKLNPGEALELECGEDIDKLAPLLYPGGPDVQRTLEQIKCLDRAITLRSPSTREALCSYTDHRRTNPSLALRFRFLTNATAGEESPPGPLLYVPGIELWERVRQDKIVGPKQPDATESIAAFLRTLEPPRATAREAWDQLLQNTQDLGRMTALISNFEWATGAVGPEDIAFQTEELILSAGHANSRLQVKAVHDRLFLFVLRMLARRATESRRRLDQQMLRSCLAAGPLTPPERELIGSVEGLRDLISAGFASVHAELADIKQITSRILATLLKPVVYAPDIRRSFEAASSDLLTWPQETQGKWVDREELPAIEQIILTRPHSCIALLGPPGSGKSALLGRLGTRFQEAGTMLLAIKADQLPSDIKTLDDLDRFLGLKTFLAETIFELAKDRRVALLIDQLDAIAALMDQHTNRLNVLLQLVHRVRDRVNVHIVISCREFDFQYDSRFASLQAEAIRLSDPPLASLKYLLDEAGVNVSALPTEMSEMLRNLQHLNLFLEHFVNDPDQPVFENYQAMLEATYRKRVLAANGTFSADCCERIAAEMSEVEEMWIGRGAFDEQYPREVDRLISSGILRAKGRRIGFRHQTLFDYVRTRAFANGVTSLSAYVLARQDAVFVRSMIWAGLTAVRSSSMHRYRLELGRLWNAPDLRKHVRLLLISFLGHVVEPDPIEVQWLMSALEGGLQGKVLSIVVGSRTWFSKLHSRLPGLMTSPEQVTKWQVAVLLRAALQFDRASVLQLVSRHWDSAEYHQFALQVFYDLPNWDEEVITLVENILRRQAVALYVVTHMAQHAAKMQSGYGPRLVSAALRREIDSAIQQIKPAESSAEEPADDQKAIARYTESQTRLKPIRSLLDGHDWHGIDEIAKSEPAAFAASVMPLLIEPMSMLASPGNPHVAQYQSISLIEVDEDLGKHHGYILHAVKLAFQSWGERDPDSFIPFAEKLEGAPLLIVHQLLAYGLERAATKRPDAVAEYVIRDPRRLAIGGYSDRHRETRLLIKAVSTHMDPPALEPLLRAVLQFDMHHADSDDDAERRRQLRRWNREHRLRLLRAFPSEKLSPAVRRQRAEEEIALPNVKDYDSRVGGGFVASPISPEQMGKAADEQIINAFQELRERPRDWAFPLRGGLLEAAQAFGVFAKQNPPRAMSVIEKLQPHTDELPAAHGVFNLGTSDSIDPTTLVDLIERLAARGFQTQEFREMSGWALQRLAVRMGGLPDHTCEMLESWLKPVRDTARGGSDDAHDAEIREMAESWVDPDEDVGNTTATERDTPQQAIDLSKGPHSLLWGMRGGEPLPHGNYPALSALEAGYLLRKTPAFDPWLDLLTGHFGRGDRAGVWSALVEHFNALGGATDRESALTLLRKLFGLFPDVIASNRGTHFLARSIRWLPEEFLKHCLQIIEVSSWPWKLQAVGEITTLRVVLVGSDEYCQSWIDNALASLPSDDSPDLGRVGIAFAAINVWTDPSYRKTAHRILLRVVEGFDPYLARAIMDIFRVANPMAPDRETRALLEFVAAHPQLIRAAGPSLIPARMKELLADAFDPALIAEVIKTLLAAVGSQVGDFRNEWRVDSGDLIEISITLQRFPETRSAGLEIFESLMDVGAYEMDRVLRELDLRPV